MLVSHLISSISRAVSLDVLDLPETLNDNIYRTPTFRSQRVHLQELASKTLTISRPDIGDPVQHEPTSKSLFRVSVAN